MPTNYLLIQAIEKFHRFLGEVFRMRITCEGCQEMTLKENAKLLAERLIAIFRRDTNGIIPAYPTESPFQKVTHLQDLILLYEYFHGDSEIGLVAVHQIG